MNFSLFSFKRCPYDNSSWPINSGDLNIILGAWNGFSGKCRESCNRLFFVNYFFWKYDFWSRDWSAHKRRNKLDKSGDSENLQKGCHNNNRKYGKFITPGGEKGQGGPSSYQRQRDEQINSLCSFQNERAFFVERTFYGWRFNAENRSKRRLFCSPINKMFPKVCRISVERQSFLNQPSVLIRTLRKLFDRLVSSTAAILPAPLQYRD